MQQQITDIQATYKQWLAVQEKLIQSQKDWREAAELMHTLKQFYFGGNWSDSYEAIQNGKDVDLTTDGEHSIMAEDTLWNAFYDYQALLWQSVRFAIGELDEQMDNKPSTLLGD